MLNSATLTTLESTLLSLDDIKEKESAHTNHKQSLQDKIQAIKMTKQQKTPPQTASKTNPTVKKDFVAEYEELTQKLPIVPRFNKEDIPDYFRHRPAFAGLITGDLNKTASLKEVRQTRLSINPELNVLKYDDFQKIALAQKSEDITIDLLRNHINGDNRLTEDLPELQKILGSLTSLNKNKMNINYSTEEFNQVQEVVLNNFNHFQPEFKKNCQIAYFTDKNNSKEDIKLSKYQRYCLLSGNGFIPNMNRPENIHDMESKEALYDLAINNLDRPSNKQKSTLKEENNVLPEITIIGDKNKIKQPSLQFDQKQLNQELKKQLQNTQ